MEQYPVRKIEKPIDWCVTVPGSKSMTNRALLMAALSDGTVTLDGVLFSDDSRHFISSLTALGFDVLVEEEKRRVTVKGEGGTIPKKEAEIDEIDVALAKFSEDTTPQKKQQIALEI